MTTQPADLDSVTNGWTTDRFARTTSTPAEYASSVEQPRKAVPRWIEAMCWIASMIVLAWLFWAALHARTPL